MSGSPSNEGIVRSDRSIPWEDRLRDITDLMRRISTLSDPQDVVTIYGERMREMLGHDGTISLSRRGLDPPRYRITRAEALGDLDPWKHPGRLPLFDSGILGDLIHGETSRIENDLRVDPSDPAAAYLSGARSLVAIPQFDQGRAMNMVVILSKRPDAFDHERLPQVTLTANLFGRATNNLVLSRRLEEAYRRIDDELTVVSDIQKSLLPLEFPYIPSMRLSSDYQSSSRAGGDYFDFFPLGGGRYGILIADVSGHGTPAAVLMAIVHAIAHLVPGGPHPPGHVLSFVNRQLAARYTSGSGAFVTAFYGVFDEHALTFEYSNAGHPSPLWRRASTGVVGDLPSSRSGLPLGILPDAAYEQESVLLAPGDALLLYTDGIPEARDAGGVMYGNDRFQESFSRACLQKHPIPALIESLAAF
ncbi:MAG TPA: PP2C family protein-serine/threonine phosphatase, partial [Phycisphaerales bacterium]|nr:PP2C family protein-serine/threonine phosphatase [Phycisphaerales bacterium]